MHDYNQFEIKFDIPHVLNMLTWCSDAMVNVDVLIWADFSVSLSLSLSVILEWNQANRIALQAWNFFFGMEIFYLETFSSFCNWKYVKTFYKFLRTSSWVLIHYNIVLYCNTYCNIKKLYVFVAIKPSVAVSCNYKHVNSSSTLAK